MGPDYKDPLDRQFELIEQRIAGLLRENHELRTRLAEAQAQLDLVHSDRQVFVKPQSMPVLDAIEALTDARPGDVLREAGTGREWVKGEGGNAWMGTAGMPPAGTVLSTPKTGWTVSREMIMADEESIDLSQPQEGEMECSTINLVSATWKTFVNRNGLFRAYHPYYGQVESNDMADLDERVRKATSIGRVKVEVPYIRFHQRGTTGNYRWEVIRGVATGIHGGNGNMLYNEGGKAKTQQFSGYSMGHFIKPMTPEDEAETLRLLNEKEKLTKQIDALRSRYAFPHDLKTEVKTLVNREREGQDSDDANG